MSFVRGIFLSFSHPLNGNLIGGITGRVMEGKENKKSPKREFQFSRVIERSVPKEIGF